MGVNTTFSRQVEDCGMDWPAVHCPPTACKLKSPAFVPVMVAGGVPMTRFVLVVLVTVTVVAGVDEPTDIFPKAIEAGDMLTPGFDADVPVPDRATGKLPAEVAMVRVAERAPVEMGVNLVVIEQVPPLAAIVPEQVLAVLGKSEGFEPVVLVEVIVMLAPVPFVRVAVCVALDEPTTMLPKFSADGLTLKMLVSGLGYAAGV